MFNLQSSITLNRIRLYGHHGLAEAEQKVGSWYEIDLTIEADVSAAALEHDDIQGTIDYSAVLRVVKDEFCTPCRLLEHLAYRIANAVLHSFDKAKAINICVRKLAPPMQGNLRDAAINLSVTKS